MTSSDDGTVKLWDLKNGEFIRNLVSLDSGGSGKSHLPCPFVETSTHKPTT